MASALTLIGVAILVAVVSFVLACDWRERHGDNHFGRW